MHVVCVHSDSRLPVACGGLSQEAPWGGEGGFKAPSLLADSLLILPTSLRRTGPTLVLSCGATTAGLTALNLSATSPPPSEKDSNT